MTLVTQKAPNFVASAVQNGNIIEEFNFYEYSAKKYVVLFFWPMDFTFVCPSEIIAFNNRYNEFSKKNVKIVGVSIDSIFVHKAWQETSIKNGGIGNIKFPIISDIKREIQTAYSIFHPELCVALRASFFIDKEHIVRHEIVNDLPLGRNINEMLRLIDAWKFYKKHGEVCPAQWEKGKKAINPTKEGISKYLSENAKKL